MSSEAALVLLRAPSSAGKDPYALAARSHGLKEVHHLPVLGTVFSNLDRLAQLLDTGLGDGEYDGVVMTSARSAEAWAEAARALSSSSVSSFARTMLPPFFVVGQGTRQALLNLLSPESPYRPEEEDVLGAEESGTGEALAHFILAHFARPAVDADGRGQEGARREVRLLYLTGDKNRDVLPSLLTSPPSSSPNSPSSSSPPLPPPRTILDPLQVYSTSPFPSFPSSLSSLLSSLPPSIRTVYFALFSPSSSAPLLSFLRDPPSPLRGVEVKFVAIGPTTRDYLVGEGEEVAAMAKRPEAESLVEVVVNAMERQKERAGEGIEGKV
ncbi:hypothetical protein JCM8547_006962 [Rhodosporidiobolus lusitaniae]